MDQQSYFLLFIFLFYIFQKTYQQTQIFSIFPTQTGNVSSIMLSNGDIVVVVNAYDINGNFEEIAQKVDNNGTLLESPVTLRPVSTMTPSFLVTLVNGGMAMCYVTVINNIGDDSAQCKGFLSDLTTVTGQDNYTSEHNWDGAIMSLNNNKFALILENNYTVLQGYYELNLKYFDQNINLSSTYEIDVSPLSYSEATCIQLQNGNIFLLLNYNDVQYNSNYLIAKIMSISGLEIKSLSSIDPSAPTAGVSYTASNLAMAQSGNLIIVYSSYNSANPSVYYAVKYAVLDQNGISVLAPTLLTNSQGSNIKYPKVVCLTNGNCVISWIDSDKSFYCQSISGIDGSLVVANKALPLFDQPNNEKSGFLLNLADSYSHFMYFHQNSNQIIGKKFSGNCLPTYLPGTCTMYLSDDQTSCTAILNCANYLSDSSGCEFCLSPYVLTSGTHACITASILNCIIYFDDGNCEVCSDTTVLSQGNTSCVTPIAHCMVVLSDDTCQSCDSLYALTTGKQCAAVILYCTTYSDSGICLTCSESMVTTETGTSCVQQISHCSAYSSYGTCQTCISPYILTSEKHACVSASVANCMSYSDNALCETCSGTMVVAEGNTTCVNQIPNCAAYFTNGTCNYCNYLYAFSTPGNTCVASITDCLTISDSGICTQCSSSTNTRLSGMACLQNISQCAINLDAGTCQTCLSPYILSSGKLACVSMIADCLSYSDDGKCETCSETKVLSLGNTACLSPNCAVYLSNATCQSCNSPYALSISGKSCVVPINDCLSYSDIGTCNRCSNLMVITTSGTSCIQEINDCSEYSIDGTCSLCNAPSGLNYDYRSCINGSVKGCEIYSDDGECQKCLENQMFNNDNTSCFNIIENCTVYLDNGTCQSCSETNILTVGKTACATPIPECVEYSDNETCLKCNTSSKIPSRDMTSCITVIPNCILYSLLDGSCQNCLLGSTLNTNNSLCIVENNIWESPDYNDTIFSRVSFTINNITQLASLPNQNNEIQITFNISSYEISLSDSICSFISELTHNSTTIPLNPSPTNEDSAILDPTNEDSAIWDLSNITIGYYQIICSLQVNRINRILQNDENEDFDSSSLPNTFVFTYQPQGKYYVGYPSLSTKITGNSNSSYDDHYSIFHETYFIIVISVSGFVILIILFLIHKCMKRRKNLLRCKVIPVKVSSKFTEIISTENFSP